MEMVTHVKGNEGRKLLDLIYLLLNKKPLLLGGSDNDKNKIGIWMNLDGSLFYCYIKSVYAESKDPY